MHRQPLALALCRVSSTEQLQNNSLNRQRSNVLARAQNLGVEIPDDGWWSGSVSSKRGTNIDRKDLQEIVERCRRDKRIKYVIVDEVDRFMRSMLELGYLLIQFKQLGVQVIFASQPALKTDTAIDTLMIMLEAFKAEGSNEERQRKSISGQVKALEEGRYPFAPKPGYQKGQERGIQEPHAIRGPALKLVLVRLVGGLTSPSQALVELNKSPFMDGHAPYKMDKFRGIVTDPFYAGIVEIDKQVKLRNENGLHEPLITQEQHYALVRIMNAKLKNQTGPKKHGNPKYPCNNIVNCDQCVDKRNGRVVGFDHGNGKLSSKVWEKYRCRACGRYITRVELHYQIQQLFKANRITKDGRNALTKALEVVWRQREGEAEQTANRLRHKIDTLKQAIEQQVESATSPDNESIRQEILAAIGRKKEQILDLESQLRKIATKAEDDKEKFLEFAFGFVENMGANFLELSVDNRLRCKQIIFPGGFYLDQNKKVYTREVSPLIRLAVKKKSAEALDFTHMVRVTGL